MAAPKQTWKIRDKGENPTLSELYGSNFNTYFTSLEIVHGGYFTQNPSRHYIRPKLTVVDYVEVHKLSYELLSDIIKVLNYNEKGNFYRVERSVGLDLGLMKLETSSDFKSFFGYLFPTKCNQVHRIYVETYKKTHIACFPNSLKKAKPDVLAEILFDFVLKNRFATIKDAREFVFGRFGVWITPFYLMSGLNYVRRRIRASYGEDW